MLNGQRKVVIDNCFCKQAGTSFLRVNDSSIITTTTVCLKTLLQLQHDNNGSSHHLFLPTTNVVPYACAVRNTLHNSKLPSIILLFSLTPVKRNLALSPLPLSHSTNKSRYHLSRTGSFTSVGHIVLYSEYRIFLSTFSKK